MDPDVPEVEVCEVCDEVKEHMLHDASMPSVECHPFKDKGKIGAGVLGPDLCLECTALEDNRIHRLGDVEHREPGAHFFKTRKLKHDRKPITCLETTEFYIPSGSTLFVTCYQTINTCCPTHREQTQHFHKEVIYLKKDRTITFQWDDDDS